MLHPPSQTDSVRFGASFGQRFLVTVDAEEEFDWNAPFDRDRHSLITIPALRQFQRFCEGHGVSPVYLVDYPVAQSPLTAEALGPAISEGRAEIGVQLHPWVNPPHGEVVNPRNSFAGNLPQELERAKFRLLYQSIERHFGAKPKIYRAGRYGLGPDTAQLLIEHGIRIDSSVRTHFDYSAEGGPDYLAHSLHPYWVDRSNGLLELPLTTMLCGALRRTPFARHRLRQAPWLKGILARTGLLERIPLTPEGVSSAEALRAIDEAVATRVPILVFSFHSPSLAPGHTPYVDSEKEVGNLYAWWRIVFARLIELDIKPTSIEQVLSAPDLASPVDPS